jgi:hypothetical protein
MGFHYAHRPRLCWVDLHPLARICGGNCGPLLGRCARCAVVACQRRPIRAVLFHTRPWPALGPWTAWWGGWRLHHHAHGPCAAGARLCCGLPLPVCLAASGSGRCFWPWQVCTTCNLPRSHAGHWLASICATRVIKTCELSFATGLGAAGIPSTAFARAR